MWTFEPSLKIGPLSLRTVPPAVTERRIEALRARVPITRVADLTALDPMGLPVFSATTPLARDLTTHLGKGADATAARVSALMEAVERVSGERAPGVTRRATYTELLTSQPAPVDPRSFDLPHDTRYRPDVALTWLPAFDLLAGTAVLLPSDLALSPPGEGVLLDVDSNGLAAGNTLLEAVVHGLCEVIERDTKSQLDFAAAFGDLDTPQPASAPVDLATLPATSQILIDRIRAADYGVVVHDVTGDIGVATFHALLLDLEAPPGPSTFGGWGTAPSAQLAVHRAITEAVQSRVGVLQAARDAFNLTPVGRRAATRARRLAGLAAHPTVAFHRTPSFETSDLRDDLAHLLDRLRGAGFTSAVAVDLTRPDLGVPVVRVRVPGLACFVVNRRRIGWRCLRYLL